MVSGGLLTLTGLFSMQRLRTIHAIARELPFWEEIAKPEQHFAGAMFYKVVSENLKAIIDMFFEASLWKSTPYDVHDADFCLDGKV